MNEIICPKCKQTFNIDEAGYADILKQVRDHQFEDELEKRLDLAAKEKENAIKLAEANLRNTLQEELLKKDREIIELKADNEIKLKDELSKKESELMDVDVEEDEDSTDKKDQKEPPTLCLINTK